MPTYVDSVHDIEPQAPQVFISYSHRDQKWLDRLRVHLAPLLQQGAVTIWADTQIRPGQEWKREIESAMASARVAVLLVTPDFLASDFIHKNELPPLLEAAEANGLTIFWVAVGASLYNEARFAKYQAANNPSQPLNSLRGAKREAEFVRIARRIKEAVQDSSSRAPKKNRPLVIPDERNPAFTGHKVTSMSQRTIVEIDLVGYSDLARNLEQQVGVEVVARFNDQIQEFVDVGLAAIHSSREDMVRATTGDGAILVFNRAVDAHTFAVAVLEATRTHNAQKSVPSAERWFRAGIATGEMHERTRPNGTPEIAGTVIANAVRLESAARPGQIVIDSATFALLPKQLQAFYGGEEIVEGKRSESFVARRYTVVPFDRDNGSSPTIQSVLELFDQLNPRDQLHRLMLRIGMPNSVRPSDNLELYLRQDKIVDWAEKSRAGLKGLEKELKALIAQQSPHR